MKTMKLTLLAVAVLSTSALAFAQDAEFSISGGVSKIGSRDIGQGYSLDDGFRISPRLTLNTWRHFGHEVSYAYNRTHLVAGGQDLGGMAIHQGIYNFLAYATPEGSKIRPYAAGGIHFSNFVPPGSSATSGGGNTKFGVNYGFGVKGRVAGKYIVRADYRQYLTGKPFDIPGASGKLKQNEISVGIGIGL
jgi:opacity protein-like surface antigen